MQNQPAGKRTLIIYLAVLSALAPFSTDMYLSSMPTLHRVMHASMANVQLTLSLFFLSFAVMLLIWGPLSDYLGRKRIILVAIVVFIIGSILCVISTNIRMLIIARIIQAAGACAGSVLSIAMVRDHFKQQHELTKALSYVTAVMMIAPVVAPIIGSYLLVHLNWQANFVFLTCYGIFLFISTLRIKESHPEQKRQILPLPKLFHAHIEQLCDKQFLLAILALSANFCVMFAFIASSSFVYIKLYHLPIKWFGYMFGFNAVSLIIANFTLPQIKSCFTNKQLIFGALAISLTGAVLMLVLLHFIPGSIWSVAVPSFIVCLGVGALFPLLTAQALDNVVQHNGIASSLMAAARFTLASGVAALMGYLIVDSALPLAIMMLILVLVTIAVMMIYFKRSVVRESQEY